MLNTETDNLISAKLRFPEFSNEWGLMRGRELFDNRREKGIEGLPLYSVTMNNGLVPRRSLYKRIENDAKTEDNIIAYPGDLVYNTMRMWQGAMGVAETKCMVSPAYVVLKPKSDTQSDFFYYLLKSSRYAHKLEAFSYGLTSDRLRLYYKDFGSIQLPVPEREEQIKIASFFKEIDGKISSLETKIRLMRGYKNSVKRAIFSRNLRFSKQDGSFYPEWQKRKLASFLSESRVKGSAGHLAKKLTVKLWGKGVIEKNEVSIGSPSTQYYSRKAGQLIYSTLDFLNGAFALIPEELDGYETTTDLPAFDIAVKHDGRFILERIAQKDFYRRFSETADGSRKARRVHAETFLKFTLDMPTLEEQTKIADFLILLDTKIDFTEDQLHQTALLKKACLQKIYA